MTTRGTQDNKPEQIKIKRKRITDEGLKLDLLIRWDISEVTVEDEMTDETHNEWEYEEESYTVTVDDNMQGAEDYITNNAYMMKLKGKAKAEAKTGKSIMTNQEKSDLRGNRANPGKGN
ncbi:MAG: hypothetical protein K9L56_15585 [Clostridiales bacterium]|nr:hypothetical protein [Clostridiales bacterium]